MPNPLPRAFGIATLVPQQLADGLSGGRAVGLGVLQHCGAGLALSVPRCVPEGVAVGKSPGTQ